MIKFPDIKIFFVDDSKTSLDTCKSHIESLNYFNPSNLYFFSDPFDLIEILDDDYADILITDYRMPGMNGDILIKTVKEKLPKIKTILFSASKIMNSFPEIKLKVENTVDVVIEKSPEMGELIESILKLCKK